MEKKSHFEKIELLQYLEPELCFFCLENRLTMLFMNLTICNNNYVSDTHKKCLHEIPKF